MGHRVDNVQCNHCISEHPQCPRCMPLRSFATTQRYPMCFFVSCDFSTVCIGHRFAIQGCFKAFFDKTFLELLDFFGGHFIRRSNVCVCPTTCLSALSKIEAFMIVLLLALFFEIISRNAARSVSIKSTAYLMAIASPSR